MKNLFNKINDMVTTELNNELKKILVDIKSEAINTHVKTPHIRVGQALFNRCHLKFPASTASLVGTTYDCYYNDDKIDIFLSRLETILMEKLLE